MDPVFAYVMMLGQKGFCLHDATDFFALSASEFPFHSCVFIFAGRVDCLLGQVFLSGASLSEFVDIEFASWRLPPVSRRIYQLSM